MSGLFLTLISPEESPHFAERLAHRVLQLLEGNNRESGEWKWTYLIGNTKFMNILGDFYFTETLKKAENESMRKYLEERKDFLIRYYLDRLCSKFVPSLENHKTGRPTEGSLTEAFVAFHSILWPPPPPSTLIDRSGGSLPLTKHDLIARLKIQSLSSFLDKTPTTQSRLILSDLEF